MHLTWLGQTCVKLQTKHLDEDTTILFNPYRPAKGEFPRSFAPNIALFSHGQNNSATLSQNPFIIDTLGEFDIKNNMINAWGGIDGGIIYKVTSENMHVVHLGNMTKKINSETLDSFGKIDILLIPVGGKPHYLDIEEVTTIITETEPRIVIPIGYQCDSDPEAAPLEKFIKEIGLKPVVTDKKIIIKPKDLPQEEMQLMVLEKNI